MKKFLIALAVVATAALTFQACQLLQPSFEAKNYDYSALKSPLKNVNVAFETVEVEAGEPKVVHFKNGSSLNVPKDAFVDANGNTISGKVSLKFRQFDDAADIIASGIPMTYKEAGGKNQQLESGGMFELKGEANGQAVFIAPDKKIQTNIASATPGAYDFYYLEPDAQTTGDQAYNWKKLTNDVDNVPATTLKGVDSFQLKFNDTEYEELGAFKDIQWQLSQKEAQWNPKEAANQWVLEEKWSRMEISQPQFKIKEVKTLLETKVQNYQGHVSVSPDSLKLLVFNPPMVAICDLKGNVISEIGGVISSWWAVQYLSNNLIFIEKEQRNCSLYDGKLNLIKSLGNVFRVRYYPEKERITCLKWADDNNYISVLILDNKGQIIKEIKYNRKLENGEINNFLL